ncbi:Sporulation kinase [Geobacillus stearothermophilus]|uniref:Sporulation kinase n=1 Tax=Geobacillus stearothermophilus TaxID=1422 RepID=A0ABQ7HH75_GEOSE|nr:Sporulation kinase [Geobacillus stearothermophilus]
MNDRLVQSQIEELERKLRAYERLIETLPFPFTFADYESGIAIEKKSAATSGRTFAPFHRPLKRKPNGSGILTCIATYRLKKWKPF